MREKDLEYIKKLVDEDINSGNLEDLKRLRSYILYRMTNGLEDGFKRRYIFPSFSSEWCYDYEDKLLNTTLLVFVTKFSHEDKVRIRPSGIRRAVSMKIYGDTWHDVLLGDVARVTKEDILKYRNVGKSSVEILEANLSRVGLSFATPITKDGKQM